MNVYDPPTRRCPVHGAQLKRARCQRCNAIYMSNYLRQRRRGDPAMSLLQRARQRAARRGLPFDLRRSDIVVPSICPALGVPITLGVGRTPHSPSLDRIQPALGYVRGNIRVISDQANRLKGAKALPDLYAGVGTARGSRRTDFICLAAYVERELLLAEVRGKAAQGGAAAEEWAKVAEFLDQAFVKADWKR
ncbi:MULTISPECIES: hypothetical protein [unclassified Brevundimonas]|uniref:hypothetical protein n=1 Tax=unclassified Brevundimonas TaxID=2622653 RepID=UPI003F927468